MLTISGSSGSISGASLVDTSVDCTGGSDVDEDKGALVEVEDTVELDEDIEELTVLVTTLDGGLDILVEVVDLLELDEDVEEFVTILDECSVVLVEVEDFVELDENTEECAVLGLKLDEDSGTLVSEVDDTIGFDEDTDVFVEVVKVFAETMLVRSPEKVDKLADLLSDDNCEKYGGSVSELCCSTERAVCVSEDIGGSALVSVDAEQLDCNEL